MRGSDAEVQAVILAGGEGTRLRPLTSTIPKPVVPLVDRPFIAYMLEWLAGHGVDDVILSCGFMADGIRRGLEERSDLGVQLRYVEEPEPLGTGGALRFAGEMVELDERFLLLNGDILTDVDLTAQLAQHGRTGASATLALVAVDDPSAYGLVRTNRDRSVREFVEKPGPEQIDSNMISAGAYVLERAVLDAMPPVGTKASIEREVFPTLVGCGLFGYPSHGYMLDIGTPQRYLEASFDVLEGNVASAVGMRVREAGGVLIESGRVDGRVIGPAFVGSGCEIDAAAIVGARAVLGRGVRVGPDARVESSVLLDGVTVGAGSAVSASILGPDVQLGDHCQIEAGVVLGEGVRVGAGNVLRAGARIFPGVELPDGAIGF